MTVRIELPLHLRRLAGVPGHEVAVELALPSPTLADALDALEAAYPQLSGTIRDHQTRQRRPFLRFFACGEDLSSLPLHETVLPPDVCAGKETLIILGAIAGG